MEFSIKHEPQKLFVLEKYEYGIFGGEGGSVTKAIVLAGNLQEAKEKFTILLKNCGEYKNFEIDLDSNHNFSITEFSSWDVGKSMWWIGEEWY